MSNATQTITGDIQLAGDLGGNNNALAPALINSGVTPGSYTAASITVDAKGRITSASNGTIALAGDLSGDLKSNKLVPSGVTPGTYSLSNLTIDEKGRITNAFSTVVGGDLSGTITNANLKPTGVKAGSYSTANVTVDEKGRVTSIASAIPTLEGDVTGPINATVLSDTGVTAGSYDIASITVDESGRITKASNATLKGDVVGPASATSLVTTGVKAGDYIAPSLTIDAKGRVLSATSTSLDLSGDITGPITSNVLATVNTAPGSYTNASITVDSKGRVTRATDGSDTPLSGDVIGTMSNTALKSTGVVEGTYNNPQITVDEKGRITSISDTSSLPIASATTLGTIKVGTGLTVNATGTLSVRPASTQELGGVKINPSSDQFVMSGDTLTGGPALVRLDQVNTFNRVVRYGISGANITTSDTTANLNLNRANTFYVRVQTAGTIILDTTPNYGSFKIIIQQIGTGHAVALGSAFRLSTMDYIDTTPNSVTILDCVANSGYLYCTLSKGFK